MDMDAFKADLRKGLSRLPRDLTETVGTNIVGLVKKHRVALAESFPALLEDLKPHVGAAMMEQACGMLDKDGIENAVMEVLAGFGVDVKNAG